MNTSSFLSFIKALLVVPVTVCVLPFACASTVDDEIQVGIEAYQAHDYQTALKYLTQGEHSQPQNALVHYYRANSLSQLHQVQQALPEYQAAYKLKPNSDIGFYSEQALNNAHEPIAPQPLVGNVAGSGGYGISTPTSQNYRTQPIQGSAATGVWSPSQSSSAGVQIMRQSRDLTQQVVDTGAVNEANIMAGGMAATNIMRRQLQSQVNRMQHAVMMSPDGTTTVPMYSQADIQRYQQQMQQRINAYMQNENLEAGNQHKLLTQKAEAVNQAAANLQAQLNAPYVPGDAHLNPVGTNLYVQSYETVPSATPPAPPPPPPTGEHAQAQSLSTLQAEDRATGSPQHRLTTN